MNAYRRKTYENYRTSREIADLENMYDILKNSRDGVITKQQTRIEEDEQGNKKEVISDVFMSEEEIIDILSWYTHRLYEIKDRQFADYLGLGMSVANLLGAINTSRKKDESNSQAIFLGLGTLINIGTLIGTRYLTRDYGKDVEKENIKMREARDELIRNEQITSDDEQELLKEMENHILGAKNEREKVQRKVDFINLLNIISMALVLGNITQKQIRDSDKLNSADLVKIILDLKSNYALINNISDNIKNVYGFREHKSHLSELERKLENIIEQIEEKQDPLIEVDKPFEKIDIKDLHGKFYPEKNYETGKTTFRHRLEVPEFHIEKGEIILLSGESGKGKSTFIKLLKRGDINNRQSIIIDGNEKVDKLGKQFIALKADKDLGSQTNLLKQLVGKGSISELSEKEVDKLNKVLNDVGMNKDGIFEELASKNYKQFSTGQQKRLVLASLLYKTGNQASILLVDEPVGNVEDKLIDEQLKVISEYARKSGMMTILTTHRVDLAERYVDRRYNIDDDGVIREVQKKEKGERQK